MSYWRYDPSNPKAPPHYKAKIPLSPEPSSAKIPPTPSPKEEDETHKAFFERGEVRFSTSFKVDAQGAPLLAEGEDVSYAPLPSTSERKKPFYSSRRFVELSLYEKFSSRPLGEVVFLSVATTGLGPEADVCAVYVENLAGKALLDEVVSDALPSSGRALKLHGITHNVQSRRGIPWSRLSSTLRLLLNGKLVFVYSEFTFRALVNTERRKCPGGEGSGVKGFGGVGCAVGSLVAQWNGVWSNTHGDYQYISLEDAAQSLVADSRGAKEPLGPQRSCALLSEVVIELARRGRLG